ncbi:MAG: acyl carrier protein [Deltaproteobacteria bacterium]|nr:MAG: acyl carrier protein [Deltaproteobacteria bacterium]
MSREQTLRTLAGFIAEVLDDELDDDLDIDEDTSFSDDLELESIEFVALAELVQSHYGDHVDFVGWISNLELDAIIGLSVGDVVDFIERSVEAG